MKVLQSSLFFFLFFFFVFSFSFSIKKHPPGWGFRQTPELINEKPKSSLFMISFGSYTFMFLSSIVHTNTYFDTCLLFKSLLYHRIVNLWTLLRTVFAIRICKMLMQMSECQVHLRKVTHRDRFLRKSSLVSAIGNRIWRDLIHNPLHLIFSVDVLGMTSSTLASLSKGFAELSTDGQFLQLRSKQVIFY